MATDLHIVLFDVAGTVCALRRSDIQELLPLPRLWRPPGVPRPVAGYFNLAGAAIPVVTLSVLFGLDSKKEAANEKIYKHLVLARRYGEAEPTALLVDRVLDILSLPSDRLTDVSSADTLNGCVEAEIDLNGNFVHLLSLERIFFEEERASLRELNAQAQKRIGEWAAG